METAVVGLFLPESAGVDDPASDHAVLVDWVEAAVANDNGDDEMSVPLRIKGIVRSHESFSALFPVVMRALVRLNTHDDVCDVEGVFRWVRTKIGQMNTIYTMLNFRSEEIHTLRDYEFAIYRKKVVAIWPLFIDGCYRSLCAEHFEIAATIGLTSDINRLVYQIGKYEIVKMVDSLQEEATVLKRVMAWVVNELCQRLTPLLASNDDRQILQDSLSDIVYKVTIKKRMETLVNLVGLYPQSVSTLEELNVCLSNGRDMVERDGVVAEFINQVDTHLLLPSIGTAEIMKFYIKTIRAFLIIDHRGVMLDKVARSIREYLALRPDTVTNTINGILDSNPNTNDLYEIHQELVKSSALVTKTQMSVNAQSFAQYLEWSPEPLEALPDFRVGKIDDIIDSFISIFEDKSDFVDELVRLFSVELLALSKSKAPITQVKFKLDLIKRKFQSSDTFTGNEFNVVDIMTHDIELSAKVDKSIYKEFPPLASVPVHGVFLSHLYWPTLTPATEAKIMDKIPPAIKSSIDEYAQKFQHFQKGRHLDFHAEQSLVTCNIEIKGLAKHIKAKVLDICVLNWFMENTKINANQWNSVKLGMIVVKSGLSLLAVKNALQFWKENEILAETNGNWKINE